jgi:hypothetical protein
MGLHCHKSACAWHAYFGAAGGATASLVSSNVRAVTPAHPIGFESKCNNRNKTNIPMERSLRDMKYFEGWGLGARLTAIQPVMPRDTVPPLYLALSESAMFRDYQHAFTQATGLSLTLLNPDDRHESASLQDPASGEPR